MSKNKRMEIRAAIFHKIIKMSGPNYDLGKGLYQEMSDGKIDSVEDFREEGNHSPGAIMNLKKKKDVNHIDFPIDDQIKSSPIMVENEPYGGLVGEGPYFPENDFEGKTPEELDFGRDYTEDSEFPDNLNEDDLEELSKKYLSPAETGILGLPDGVNQEGHDAGQTNNNKNPYYGISDEGRQMYEDKWNI